MDATTKRNNFKKVAERRTNEILKKIGSFKNFKNKAFYEYKDEEIEKIARAIVQEVKDVIMPLIKENK